MGKTNKKIKIKHEQLGALPLKVTKILKTKNNKKHHDKGSINAVVANGQCYVKRDLSRNNFQSSDEYYSYTLPITYQSNNQQIQDPKKKNKRKRNISNNTSSEIPLKNGKPILKYPGKRMQTVISDKTIEHFDDDNVFSSVKDLRSATKSFNAVETNHSELFHQENMRTSGSSSDNRSVIKTNKKRNSKTVKKIGLENLIPLNEIKSSHINLPNLENSKATTDLPSKKNKKNRKYSSKSVQNINVENIANPDGNEDSEVIHPVKIKSANKSSNVDKIPFSDLFDWPGMKDSGIPLDEKSLLKLDTNINIQNNGKDNPEPLNERKLIKNVPKPKKSKPLMHMYELNYSKILVLLQPGALIYFVGILELELLRGCLEILGCRLSKPNNNLLIFSLQGSCHLYLKAESYSKDIPTESPNVLLEKLLLMGLSKENKMNVLKEAETATFLLVNRNNNHTSSYVWPDFFKNYFSFSVFPASTMLKLESRIYHNIERKIDCLFEDASMDLGLKKYNEIQEWLAIERGVLAIDFPKTVLCGGKSVGKSTFLRYITNKCLQKWPQVLILDFDIGQCEFTVGGCISVTMVDKPLLGPNYSHLKEPQRCVFLGEVDVTKCPQTYIEGCKLLVDYARHHYNDTPWIVNTMGFTRGFGVTLNCGIIKKISPTHVVQIDSKDKKLNFPENLMSQFVLSQNVDSFVTEYNTLNYKLYVIPSASEASRVSNPKSRGVSPAEARNLVMLSYFSEMLSPNKSSLTQVIPHKISLGSLELYTTGKDNLTKDEIAVTMNGNMVALCESSEDHSLFPNCRGFGIVRAIDWESRTLYLITPLASSSLRTVDCLVKGTVTLPESLYYNPGECVTGHVPYVAHTSGSSTARFARREFRPQRDDKRLSP